MVFRSDNNNVSIYRCWRWCFSLIIIICLYTGVGDGVSV